MATNPQASQLPNVSLTANSFLDLDTICTSVVLAYLRTYTSTSKSDTLYIPISNLPRADLPLRLELLPVLARANITTSDFITLSDLPSIKDESTRIPSEKTRWILIDHNALQGDLGRVYGSRVVGCIDHHVEEHKVPENTGDEPRVIDISGSCASLVVDYCREAWAALAEKSTDEESKIWDAEIASMALGPILIDTGNLADKVKTTHFDVDSAQFLEKFIMAQNKGFIQTDYWQQISDAKHNIDSLDLAAVLRKDYKQWDEASNTLGISSTIQNITYLLKKAGNREAFLAAFKKHSEERNLSMVCLMASFHDGKEYTRELFLWAWGENGVKAAKQFEEDCTKELGLEKWGNGTLDLDGETEWRRCWWQRKTEHSRKRVAPLMRTSIKQAA